jgi:alkylated DNA repair protein (DNA oxidative demethylase)
VLLRTFARAGNAALLQAVEAVIALAPLHQDKDERDLRAPIVSLSLGLPYHAVMPLADGEHGLLGRRRVNLTFRVAG